MEADAVVEGGLEDEAEEVEGARFFFRREGHGAAGVEDDVEAGAGAALRPSDRVPTKMPMVTARTAKWPRNAPEQPATAMGAMAARYHGVSFMRGFSQVSGRGLSNENLHRRQRTTPLGDGTNFYRRAVR